jgi:Putative MetA-pathway of phenol degradation
MLARISAAVLALILAGMMPLHGQDQSPSVDAAAPIATDRPAITNSSVVVPAGSFQVENGFLKTSGQGQSVLDGPESLVRFGTAKRTELRLTVPDYFYSQHTGDGPGSGFGDFALGVKEQLGPTLGKFDVSVILFLSFPSGTNTVSSSGYDPGLQVPWSRALSANWTAAGMFSVYWPTQGPTRNVTGEFTFLLDRQLAKPSPN